MSVITGSALNAIHSIPPLNQGPAEGVPAEAKTVFVPVSEAAQSDVSRNRSGEQPAREAERQQGYQPVAEKQQEQEGSSDSSEQTTEAELEEIRSLATTHREVIAHEQAHRAAGGKYAGAMSLTYERGPDGVNYAVAGEVQINTSEVAGDPEATIAKARQIKQAALAPASPSSQDYRVAADARQMENQAMADLRSRDQQLIQSGEQLQSSGSEASGSGNDTASVYSREKNMAELEEVSHINEPEGKVGSQLNLVI